MNNRNSHRLSVRDRALMGYGRFERNAEGGNVQCTVHTLDGPGCWLSKISIPLPGRSWSANGTSSSNRVNR